MPTVRHARRHRLEGTEEVKEDDPCTCARCGELVGHLRHSRSVCYHQRCWLAWFKEKHGREQDRRVVEYG